jgi:hypothetical protein
MAVLDTHRILDALVEAIHVPKSLVTPLMNCPAPGPPFHPVNTLGPHPTGKGKPAMPEIRSPRNSPPLCTAGTPTPPATQPNPFATSTAPPGAVA